MQICVTLGGTPMKGLVSILNCLVKLYLKDEIYAHRVLFWKRVLSSLKILTSLTNVDFSSSILMRYHTGLTIKTTDTVQRPASSVLLCHQNLKKPISNKVANTIRTNYQSRYQSKTSTTIDDISSFLDACHCHN